MIPIARREMVRAADWYEGRAEGLGHRFLNDIRASLLVVKEFPFAFPPLDEIHRRKQLDIFPYGLIYRTDGDIITIMAVANLKRRPRYWHRRTA
jgi:toxin ParE1/3/4